MIEIFNDEEFKNLSVEEKKSVGLNYFNQEIADEEFNSLSEDEKQNIYNNFLESEIGITQTTEDNTDVKQEQPIEEKTRESLIEEEYNNNILKINNAKKNIDTYGFDEDTKATVLANYDNALIKIEKQRQDDLIKAKEQKIKSEQLDEKLKRNIEIDKSGELDALNRVDVGLGAFQGEFRKNIVAPAAKLLGMDEYAKEIEESGQVQVDKANEVQKLFEERYGKEAWNIYQRAGEFTPDVVMSIVQGAKNIPSAIGEAGITYARTGDVGVSATAGIVSLLGGKLADKLFSVGAKQVKTAFGKEIEKLPLDQQKSVNDTLDVLKDSGIDEIDKDTRKKVLEQIDLTGSKTDLSNAVKKEIKTLKDKRSREVSEAYVEAHKIAKKSKKKELTISNINDALKKNDVLETKKVKAAKAKIAKLIAKKEVKLTPEELAIKQEQEAISDALSMGAKKKVDDIPVPKGKEFNAYQMEGLIRSLKDEQRDAKASAIKVYDIAIDYIQKQQDEVANGAYNKARKLSLDFNTAFKGKIKGEGAETGIKIEKLIKSNKEYDIANELLTRGVKPDLVKNLDNLGLSQASKTKLAKDLMSKGIDTTNLDSINNVKKVISNFKAADPNGMAKLMGNEAYTKLRKEVTALENVNNVLNNDKIDDQLQKSVTEFLASAMMVKISPVYAGKGMIYNGKEIIKKTIFRREANKIRERFKDIKDRTIANKAMRAFNSAIIGYTSSELDKIFEEE